MFPAAPRRLAILALLSTLGLAAGTAGARAGEGPPPDEVLRATLERAHVPPAVRRHGERLQAWNALQAFYRQRSYQPAWWDGAGARPAAARLLAALDDAASDGLDARLYPRDELRSLLATLGAAPAGDPPGALTATETVDRVHLDVGLSYVFLALAAHLSIGRLQAPETVRVGWHARPARRAEVDLARALQLALAGDQDVAGTLAAVAPQAEAYQTLRRALAGLRDLAAQGGWPSLAPGPRLRRGDRGPRVADLARRLAASGELAGVDVAADPELFDDALAAAVARFQTRHGSAPTGEADRATLGELAVPIERRIRQVELNMERWRWLGGDLGDRYLLVNVPDFSLRVVDGGQVVMTMKVIVGKAQRSTPVFSDLLTQIVLNPSWNVPDSITAREMIPRLLREPGYLRHEGIQIERKDQRGGAIDAAALTAAEIGQLGRRGSPFKLRQPPGPGNALGRFKFVVPNQFDVYLHDTPTGQLFARSDREFSHGCIRLEKPAELAGYLLRDDPRWTPDAVADQLRSGRTVTIDLIRPLPAHILYLTAWVAADGALELRRDIYRQDARLDAALQAETPLWEDLAALFPAPTITAPRTLSGTGEPVRNES